MAATSSGTATVTLPTDRQILITREFDAPRHLVYKAWTTPKLVKRWWHANRGRVTIAEIDLRVGGAWRYVSVTESGPVVVVSFAVQREVAGVRSGGRCLARRRGARGRGCTRLVTVGTFARGGRRGTDHFVFSGRVPGRGATPRPLTVLVEHPTREGRDAHINSGMEPGMQDALDLLEQVAVSLR